MTTRQQQQGGGGQGQVQRQGFAHYVLLCGSHGLSARIKTSILCALFSYVLEHKLELTKGEENGSLVYGRIRLGQLNRRPEW